MDNVGDDARRVESVYMTVQNPVTGFRSSNSLELLEVSCNFGALKAIDNITFSVQAGQRYAVLGSNGAGKTTLFNVITGDFFPTSGRIFLFGEDVTELPPHERARRGLRRTYQSSLLFRDLSVRDNFFLAVQGVSGGRFSFRRKNRTDPAYVAVEELLEHMHLTSLADTPVSALSHGQQRLVEVGMALAGSPRLVLFDEPAAGLSTVERAALVKLLKGLPSHLGFVIIEHDLDVALRVSERVTVMHSGRVLKHGSPEEVENDAEVQAIYMGGHGRAHH